MKARAGMASAGLLALGAVFSLAVGLPANSQPPPRESAAENSQSDPSQSQREQQRRQQQSEQPRLQDGGSRADLIAHGEYIVHHVAMCIKCHSPTDENGEVVPGRLLMGARMPVDPPSGFKQEWAVQTPRIAGLPGGWSEQQVAHFLETGEPPTDHEVRAPMPPFRMQPRDARGVAAYLNSLR